MVPFIKPCTDSFSEYLKNSIIKPHRSLGIVEGILDHFEIELDEDENENEEHFVGGDDTKRQSSQMVITVEKEEGTKRDHKVESKRLSKNQVRRSSDHQNRTNCNEEATVSRWDFIDDENSIELEKKKTHDTTTTMSKDVTQKNKNAQHKATEKKPIFLIKQEIKVQPNSQNPLLANGRGTYIGRQLSNNFFNQMNVVSRSSDTVLKSKQRVKNNDLTLELKKEEEEPYKRKHFVHKSVTSLGSAVSFRKGNLEMKGFNQSYNKNDRKRSRVERSCQKSSSKSLRQGAAALAARAGLAMRKKTKI